MGKTYLTSLLLLCVSQAFANEQGKSAYEANCKACHALNEMTVGPSIKEIQSLYPKEKQAEFLSWTKVPGKKRQDAIQMPAMSHLDDDSITDIFNYLHSLKAVKKKKSNKRHNFTFTPPPPTYPYYKRAYMPFASPAAIAIVFSPELGLSWDATTCRLRYIYHSKQFFLSGENNKDKLKDDLVYQETAAHFWSFSEGNTLEFVGYRLVNTLPQFIYQIGEVNIIESYALGETPLSITRQFTLSGHDKAVSLDLSTAPPSIDGGKVELRASKGKIVKNKLILSKEEANEFVINMRVVK
ncbi:c-type cytochrome [Agaribacter flavus]|uniref:C-type cytochrome n=1 Tax=Agaribacter flavus TaxID=1902781 RepID=A0ABV7FQG4_9ALTE